MTTQERSDFAKRYGLTAPSRGDMANTGTPIKTAEDGLSELEKWRASRVAASTQKPEETKDSLNLGETTQDVLSGQLKGAANTALGMGELGSGLLEKGYNATIGRLTGEKAFEGSQMARDVKESEVLQPQGMAQKIGFGTEKVAEMFSPMGQEKAAAGLAGKLAIKGEGVLPKAANVLSKLASSGATEAADVGLKTAASTGSLEEGKGAGLLTAGLGTAMRGAGQIKKLIGPSVASRFVNSLISPSVREFAYGKNPGKAIADEGIIANSYDDLAEKISTVRKNVGESLGQALKSHADKTVDVSASLEPIDQAIKNAAKGGKNNAPLVERLRNLKDALMFEHDVDAEGNIIKGAARNLTTLVPEEAGKLKTMIGDLTKWTGNTTDDALTNKALKNTYGNVRSKIEEVAPETKKLNERYANLTSAEVATKHKDILEQKKNLVSAPIKMGGIFGTITAIASGGAALPAIAAGLGAAAVEKALATPAAKTRMAQWFAKATPEQKTRLYKAVPQVFNLLNDKFGSKKD